MIGLNKEYSYFVMKLLFIPKNYIYLLYADDPNRKCWI